jgi:hypothetical protein
MDSPLRFLRPTLHRADTSAPRLLRQNRVIGEARGQLIWIAICKDLLEGRWAKDSQSKCQLLSFRIGMSLECAQGEPE